MLGTVEKRFRNRTVAWAVERGYFDTPRDGSLQDIVDEFSVFSPAVSKNRRRARRKVNEHVASALDELR